MQLSDLSRELGDLNAAVSYGRRGVDAYESLPPAEELARRGSSWFALGKAASLAGRRTEACVALRRAHEYFTKASVAPLNEREMLQPDALASVGETLKTCPPT